MRLNHRLGIESDLHAVYELYMDELSNPFLTYDPMDEEQFGRIFYSLLPQNNLHVVELDGEVIATYRLIPKTDRQAHTVYLGGFVVGRSLQRKGIGQKILEHITSSVLSRGKMRIELTVDIENTAAINLYKKAGFLIEGRIRKSYKRNSTGLYYDEYLMGAISSESGL